MNEPLWISEELALAIHNRQIAEHGGMSGVRDMGLLSSALARPRHLWSFARGQVDLAQLAASYAFGIAKNHAFVDGNKRTAAVVCETFLNLNASELFADDQAMCLIFLQLAEGKLAEDELVDWIRQNYRKTAK